MAGVDIPKENVTFFLYFDSGDSVGQSNKHLLSTWCVQTSALGGAGVKCRGVLGFGGH